MILTIDIGNSNICIGSFEDDKLLFASTKSQKRYSDAEYDKDTYILFGPETRGLPEPLLKENYDRCIRIPMANNYRSLNLSNSVAIIVYEALRQTGFKNLCRECDYLYGIIE